MPCCSVCVRACDVFIRYADATESAAGMWHNMQLSRESFFFFFLLPLFQAVESYHYLPYEGARGENEKNAFLAQWLQVHHQPQLHPNDEREFQRAQD